MHITLISSLLANFSRAEGKLKWHWQIQFAFAKYCYFLLVLIQSLASLHSYKFIRFVPLQNSQLNGAVKILLKEVHPSMKGCNSYIYIRNFNLFCQVRIETLLCLWITILSLLISYHLFLDSNLVMNQNISELLQYFCQITVILFYVPIPALEVCCVFCI